MAIGYGQPCPKSDRLAEHVTKRKDREQRERDWRAAIWKRDDYTCQVSGNKVKRTINLDPLRGECHHVYPKSTYPWLRFEVDNGVLLSLEVHLKAQKDVTILPRAVRDRARACYRRMLQRDRNQLAAKDEAIIA